MKLTTRDRTAPFHRILLWLHERPSGTANLGEVSKFVWGRGDQKTVVNVARALTTRGWAECAEQTGQGKYIWIFDRKISLLPAGRIWADFLLHGQTGAEEWTWGDMLSRIRALENALRPFADLGLDVRQQRGAPDQMIRSRFERGDLEMAADLLRPYTEGATMYPWSPSSARGRPWLKMKSQSDESLPTEQPAPSG